MQKKITKALSLIFLSLFFTGTVGSSALAAPSPEAAPREFFEAVYKLDYVKAWNALSSHSQDKIIQMLLAEEEKKEDAQTSLSPESLRKLIEQGDPALRRGFWTRLRQAIGIEVWMKQSFKPRVQGPEEKERFVMVTPANIALYVVQNAPNDWRFGYIESFVEARRPQKDLPEPKE